MSDPLQFLISTLIQLYVFVLLLRFVMQWVRADFYNPLSQFIVKVTTPVLRPFRRVIPGFRGLDIATLVVAMIFLMLMRAIIFSLQGATITVFPVFIVALTDLVSQVIDIFFYAILIQAVMSWVNPHGYNPAMSILYSITGPVLRPVQRLIPQVGGIDISPVFAMIGLKFMEMIFSRILIALIQ